MFSGWFCTKKKVIITFTTIKVGNVIIWRVAMEGQLWRVTMEGDYGGQLWRGDYGG